MPTGENLRALPIRLSSTLSSSCLSPRTEETRVTTTIAATTSPEGLHLERLQQHLALAIDAQPYPAKGGLLPVAVDQ